MSYEEKLAKEVEFLKEEIVTSIEMEDYEFAILLLGNLQALDEEEWLIFGANVLETIEYNKSL